MNRQLCLASFFLALDEENTRWWLRLQDELDARGLDLVLLSATTPTDPRLRTIQFPFWLTDFPQNSSGEVTLEPSLADVLARRDHAWHGQPDKELAASRAGLAACQQVLRAVLKELQPALVLVWGNSLPQSVVLQQLAVQQGRPCWVIERGFFPGTLMVELAGQGGQTEHNLSFSLQNAWRYSTAVESLFRAAQQLFRTRRNSKYAQSEFLSPEMFSQQHNPDGKKLVALLLQHDAASGLIPDDFPGTRVHSPLFKSAADALAHLTEATRTLGCRLIAKPHPTDRTDYSKFNSDSVTVSGDVNLHSLMGTADVIATMTSTAQFEALLSEKPLLLLARSALTDKGVAYEPKTPAGLTAALKSALNQDDFANRQSRAQRFVSFVLQNSSVSLSDEVPTGATLGDFAGFLSQNAVAAAPTHTLEDRLAGAANCLTPEPAAPKRPTKGFESTEALLERAESLRQASKWNEAGEVYLTLCNRLPDDCAIWCARLECARQQGHSVMADLILDEALERHPEWAAALKEVAEAAPAKPAPVLTKPTTLTQTPSASVSERMKREWNERAAENARYYVRSTTRDQSEEEFDASGRDNVERLITAELPRIAPGRNPQTMTMLEIGCGVGRMSKHFARYFGQVHAIDVSGEMIRQARERVGVVSSPVFHETSGADLALFTDEMFDLVFSFIVFQHIPDRAVIFNYIREAHRVLKPGGVFKFQVQGCTEKAWMESTKDTWFGVTITEEDVADLSKELGFDLLAKSGQGTQYAWYALRKQVAAIPQFNVPAESPATLAATN